MRLFALSWLIATCALAQTAAAAGPSRGELLYQTCTACHTILGDGVGPDLTGIYRQPAGKRAGFNYSAALSSSGLVWVDATLRAYLRNPQAVIKGTTMAIPGYTSDTEFNAVIAVIRKLK